MPNSPNAQKALRQSEKRRLHNRNLRSALRTVIKKARSAAAEGGAAADEAVRIAVKRLDQAAAKGLIHKNTASRTKSRLVTLKKKSAS
ncbi:30S ribosomal protein S20 [Thalassoglobus neptunius]|uniref:Small ribosomal subunit protein bS20 n=1 Tax=Thalassoglobus neptunius TaxID=1938619 RepID=A0A5C5WH13_9PLAN|nr:30S ribosomal protein S20 [Thalassoglobus neptunius]TWT49837.1 30S ribosomal protein S20 [Thalassoglobus neptunius]